MKSIRVVFSALAITLAGAAVYANASVATIYFRATQDITLDPTESPDCDVEVSPIECSAGSHQCTQLIEVGTTTKTYRISKKVDNGPCVIVPKP